MDGFKMMLLDISNGLDTDNVNKLKFLCEGKIGKKKSEDIANGIQLFEYLIQRVEIGPNDTQLLRELLATVGREDLLPIIDDYERTPPPIEPGNISMATDVIVANLGKNWRKYGRKLGISDAKLDGIEERHPRNLEEMVREVIREWKRMRKEQAQVNELIAALRACNQNYTADLVEKTLSNASSP
ncbi:protein FADD [Hoplias malabaricus]|uniref:protein FADD n=1 Tax=Hoplias malabaricus TaxID=27720 RepID=UPI0034622E2D